MAIVLRVQSSEGTKRLSVKPDETTKSLYEKIHSEFDMDSYDFRVFVDRARTKEIFSSTRNKLAAMGLKHGDMLFIACGDVAIRSPVEAPPPEPEMPEQTEIKAPLPPMIVIEDDVDLEINKRDGKVKRPRDPAHCRHGTHSQCVHCFPLDPWDETVIRESGIKHMSFNAYLRKLTSGLDKGKFVGLENLNCSIKPDCPSHPPWPKALCSKCAPPAITLTRQKYRHIDHVMFENAKIVDRFLDYWRATGNQRLGFLYGYHEPHDSVPLGIRTVVVAIYEPPQDSTKVCFTNYLRTFFLLF
jgi:nuclear protein localization family protein 4